MFTGIVRVAREAPLVIGAVVALAFGVLLTALSGLAFEGAAVGYVVGLNAGLAAILKRFPTRRPRHSRRRTARRIFRLGLYVTPLYIVALVAPWEITFTAVVSFLLGAGALTVVHRAERVESSAEASDVSHMWEA